MKMRFLIYTCSLFLLLNIGNECFSQKKISKLDLEKDFSFLKKKLELHHLGMYFYESEPQLLKKWKDLQALQKDSLNQTKAYWQLAEWVAEIKDMHTSVHQKTKTKKKDQFPFIIRKFGNDFFLHYNASADTTILRNAKITALNNEPILSLYQKLQNLYGTDNGNPTSKAYYAERAFGQYFQKYHPAAHKVTITYKNPTKDSSETKSIAFVDEKAFMTNIKKRYKNAVRSNFEFSVLDSVEKIAKLDITSFQQKANKFDIFHVKFKKSLKKKFTEIEKQNIRHLIVDFRANGGGFVPNVARITKYVSDEPFKLMDSLVFKPASFNKLFPFYSLFPPLYAHIVSKKNKAGHYIFPQKKQYRPIKKHHYDGQLYVLMDGGSYSATTFTLGLWRDMNLGTFIGTRPGGANWGSFAGQWKTITLPNSGVKVKIPLMKITHHQSHQTTKAFFIEPDFYVEPLFEDFEKREDTSLKFTLNLIKNKIQSSK
jgi:Peptidase family S41